MGCGVRASSLGTGALGGGRGAIRAKTGWMATRDGETVPTVRRGSELSGRCGGEVAAKTVCRRKSFPAMPPMRAALLRRLRHAVPDSTGCSCCRWLASSASLVTSPTGVAFSLVRGVRSCRLQSQCCACPFQRRPQFMQRAPRSSHRIRSSAPGFSRQTKGDVVCLLGVLGDCALG